MCINSRQVDPASLVTNAEVAGTVQLWEWIGDGATTFSFYIGRTRVDSELPGAP